MYQLPVPRISGDSPYLQPIAESAAWLTCTTAEFAWLWQEVMGVAWDAGVGASDPVKRQRLRDELDGLAARLYGLARGGFEHILGTFPLVFPNAAQGKVKKNALLAVFDTCAIDAIL